MGMLLIKKNHMLLEAGTYLKRTAGVRLELTSKTFGKLFTKAL